jgi:hypothetical protein
MINANPPTCRRHHQRNGYRCGLKRCLNYFVLFLHFLSFVLCKHHHHRSDAEQPSEAIASSRSTSQTTTIQSSAHQKVSATSMTTIHENSSESYLPEKQESFSSSQQRYNTKLQNVENIRRFLYQRRQAEVTVMSRNTRRSKKLSLKATRRLDQDNKVKEDDDEEVICYVCGNDRSANMRHPEVILQLRSLGLSSLPDQSISCELLYDTGLNGLLYQSECDQLVKNEMFQEQCGCTNTIRVSTASPVSSSDSNRRPTTAMIPASVPTSASSPTVEQEKIPSSAIKVTTTPTSSLTVPTSNLVIPTVRFKTRIPTNSPTPTIDTTTITTSTGSTLSPSPSPSSSYYNHDDKNTYNPTIIIQPPMHMMNHNNHQGGGGKGSSKAKREEDDDGDINQEKSYKMMKSKKRKNMKQKNKTHKIKGSKAFEGKWKGKGKDNKARNSKNAIMAHRTRSSISQNNNSQMISFVSTSSSELQYFSNITSSIPTRPITTNRPYDQKEQQYTYYSTTTYEDSIIPFLLSTPVPSSSPSSQSPSSNDTYMNKTNSNYPTI